MYKINRGFVPRYLSNLFPSEVGQTTNYNLRNVHDYVTPNRRTSAFANSFVPSSVDAWNKLPAEVRNLPTLVSFKREILSRFYVTPNIPSYFLRGPRRLSVLHCRIRNNCSDLNADLYDNHLVISASCACGNSLENAEHFFFQCPRFINQRHQLFQATRQFHPLNCDLLMFGNSNLNIQENNYIFDNVQRFIKDSNRFE